MTEVIPVAITAIVVIDASQSFFRLIVAGVNFTSAIVAMRATAILNKDLQPHLIFISLWSFVTSMCMVLMAIHAGGPYIVDIFNGAAAMMITGWTLFLARLLRRVNKADKLVKKGDVKQ